MRTRSNFVFLAVALMTMAAIFGGCESITKITAPDQVTDQPGQTGPATVTFSLPGEDALQKSASVLEIEADFTGGKKEVLAASYSITYWAEHSFKLYKDGVVTYAVLINGKLVPTSAISEDGRMWFIYEFDPLRLIFPGEFNYSAKNAGLSQTTISFQQTQDDYKSAKCRSNFDHWSYVSMTKTVDKWNYPDHAAAYVSPDTNKVNFWVTDQAGREYFATNIKVFVDGTLLDRAYVVRNGTTKKIELFEFRFIKRANGEIINLGNENVLAASIGFGGN